MGNNIRRLSISLDDETFKMVEKIQEESKTSKADVLRMLIRYYNDQKKIFDEVDVETMMIYIDYLVAGEHVILDVDFLCAIFGELENASENFWELVRQSGKEHGAQYRKKGMKSMLDILYYVSKSNLFRLKVDSLDYYTLILISPIPNLKRFIKVFLEGIFETQLKEIKITESPDKLMVQVIR